MTTGADTKRESASSPTGPAVGDFPTRRKLLDGPHFWERVVGAMADGLAVVDPEGVLIDVNPAFSRLVGFEREELVGLSPPFPYWPREALAEIESVFARALQGESATFELVLCRKSGERFPVLVNPVAIRDAEGRMECVIATFKDISVRKKLESTLRSSEERWRSIAENPFDFVVIIDADYKYLYVNHTAPGLRSEDLVGKATPFD